MHKKLHHKVLVLNMLVLLVVVVYLAVWLKDVFVISSVTSVMTAVLILKILDAFH